MKSRSLYLLLESSLYINLVKILYKQKEIFLNIEQYLALILIKEFFESNKTI